MDLYLINAATDAKRQTCFDMTEVSIWYLSKAKVQRRKKMLLRRPIQMHEVHDYFPDTCYLKPSPYIASTQTNLLASSFCSPSKR